MTRAPSRVEREEAAVARARVLALLRQGWPLRAIAAASGVPSGTLACVANGRHRRISPRNADRLGNAFGVLHDWSPRRPRPARVPAAVIAAQGNTHRPLREYAPVRRLGGAA